MIWVYFIQTTVGYFYKHFFNVTLNGWTLDEASLQKNLLKLFAKKICEIIVSEFAWCIEEVDKTK